jgi:predicted MFS family arabinose efflux permease
MTTGTVAAPRLLNGRTVLFLLAAVSATTSFYLLLTVVPLYAVTRSGAQAAGAGLATAVLMLTTVVAELAAPRVIARIGRRTTLAISLLLLGPPALILPLSAHPVTVLGVCGLRGLGFGLAVVIGSAWMADLVPAERRGEGLGVYGAAMGVPAIVALPLGVWLIDRVGFGPVFVAGAATALAGLTPLLGLPPGYPSTGAARFGVLGGLRSGPLVRPAVVFAATATAAGILVTFLPLAATQSTVVAPALLVQAGTATFGRWWAGRHDRHGTIRLLIAGAVTATVGLLGFVPVGRPVAVLAGAAAFGFGFGVAQNASISLMFRSVPDSARDTASAVWNIAYDAGMGVGAAAFGLLVGITGFPVGFALAAALIPLALLTLLPRHGADRRAERPEAAASA